MFTQFLKRLIDGVAFNPRGKTLEGAHHALTHVSVKRIVRGEDVHSVFAELFLDLEYRRPHRQTERLRLVGTSDDAAIVIRKHHHRLLLQPRIEDAFTGNVEIVAVGKGQHQTWRIT